jgi:nucleotide-binding universal stress UspA family protein
MTTHVVVSYDDTQNDHDALMFGRLLHEIGATLTLAYVRHAVQANPDHERLAAESAAALLARGAELLDDPDVERRVVISASTAEGLRRLSGELSADVIAFGSDYRTPLGHVAAGRSAQTLLENGSAAVAIAPAGFAQRTGAPALETVAILPGTADEAAIQTAHSIAARHDATVTNSPRGADLLVVGSRPEAREGRVMITSSAALAIEEATAPVLVVARGVALSFESLVTV